MGMDLVPVYADTGNDMGEGAVKVPAEVQHNIGLRLGTVKKGQFSNTISALGRIQIAEDQQSVVSPRIEGWVEKLHVKTTNESVLRGQALFEIYSPGLVTAQEEYLAALKANNKILANSARSRLQSLQVPNALLARVEQARKVERTVVFTAPQSGVVAELNIQEGKFVTPGTTVMRIAKLDPVWLVAEVFEQDVKGLTSGNDMTVRFDGGKTINTTVNFIYPVLESMTRTLKVRAVLPNTAGQLKPNMFAEAKIQLLDEAPVLLVPVEALIRLGDQDRVVLALDGSSFKSVEVEIGRVGDEFAEVYSGLRDGDRVVTSAQFLIDSESSKSSDFKRMDLMPDAIFQGMHEGMDHSSMDHDMGKPAVSKMDHSSMDHDMGEPAANKPAVAEELIWVEAKIQAVDVEGRILSLTHEAIPEWNRPSMTMRMNAAANIDLQNIQVGADYDIQFSEDGSTTTGFMVEQLALPARLGE
jgi:Cu(I)/Ag(I) efflux system membrane fusion protein